MARWFDGRRIFTTCCAVTTLSSASVTPAAVAMPNTQCALVTPVAEVHHVSEVPPEFLKLLPPIADVGTPFNSTDWVSNPSLPFRRLVRAGNRDTDWFIWYEHGGAGYFWQVVAARIVPGNDAKVLADAGTISDTLCRLTDGVFAGQVPPYPSGSWGASDF